jgi:hypothetical protein
MVKITRIPRLPCIPSGLYSFGQSGPFRRALCGSHIAPLTSGVVVGIGRLLWRAHVLRNVSQIDANAGPGRGTSPHGVDQHVIDAQQRGYWGMFRLPAFEPCKRGLFMRRVSHYDQGHLGSCLCLLGPRR